MELEEFKEMYNSSIGQAPVLSADVNDIVLGKSRGPLAKLEKNLVQLLYILLIAIVLFGAINMLVIGFGETVRNPVFVILFIIFFSEFLFSVFSYVTVKKMQDTMGDVKGALINKIATLKRFFKWHLIIYIGLFLLMPLYLELNIHFQFTPNGVGKINVFIRLAWYVLIFFPLYKIKQEQLRLNFTWYLDELNGVLAQAE
jgi:hypothetical protein